MSQLYTKGIEEVGKALTDLDGSDLRALLVKSSYTYSQAHTFVDDGSADDPKSHEVSVGGYGRATLANKTFSAQTIGGLAAQVLDCDDPAFGSCATGETLGGVVVFRHTGDDTTAPLVCWFPLTATPTNGSPISAAIPAAASGGLVYLDSPVTS